MYRYGARRSFTVLKNNIQLRQKIRSEHAVPSFKEHYYRQTVLETSPKLSNASIFYDLKTEVDIQV